MVHYFDPAKLTSSLKMIGKNHAYADGRTPLDIIIENDAEIRRISSKCLSGSHKFTTYSLKLFLKGRGSSPREICVPSLVDQAVLKSLDLSLKENCKITNTTKLAFFIVKEVLKDISNVPQDAKVLRLDIKKYFDSIDHDKLLNRLDSKGCPLWMKTLVHSAIKTPAKELHEKTPPPNKKGVPQGLSIASHLADMYLESFENVLKKYSIGSHRYVDDILIFYHPETETELLEFLVTGFKELDLDFHKDGDAKFYKGDVISEKGFDYLGYHFVVSKDVIKVSVRYSSVQKFLNSIIGLITKYQKGGYGKDAREAESAFVFDLNEKITGAFRDDKRYGWLWYFRQMNDLALLQRMDRIIDKELKKESSTKNLKIKKLKRTYYEIQNFTNDNRYILNYGMKDVMLIKRYYGRFDKRINYAKTDEVALAAFQFWSNGRLKRLMLDEVRAS